MLALVAGATGVASSRHWGHPALVALVPQSVAVPGLAEVGINRARAGVTRSVDRADGRCIFGSIPALMTGAHPGWRGPRQAGARRVARRVDPARGLSP